MPAPLLYVSEGQINFLIPAKQGLGKTKGVRSSRRPVRPGGLTFTMTDAAPALFVSSPGFAIATHGDNSLITPDKPADQR